MHCKCTFKESGLQIRTSGGNWISSNSGINYDNDITCFNIEDTNTIYVGTRAGIYMSNDLGMNWQSINTSIYSETPINVLVNNNFDIIAGATSGIFSSSNNGFSWDLTNNSVTNVSSIAINDSNIYVGYGYGSLMISSDSGNNWISSNLPQNSSDVHVTFSGNNVYAANENGVYVSTNNGLNWTTMNNGLPTGTYLNVTSLYVKDSYIYLCTIFHGIYRKNLISGSWVAITNGLPSGSKIMAISSIDSILFIGTFSNGIYTSTNNGDNWVGVNNGISNYTIRSFATNDSVLIAGTDNGIFITYNKGINWLNVSNGIPQNRATNSIIIIGTSIYTAISGLGVWQQTLSELTLPVYKLSSDNNKSFAVYPNPSANGIFQIYVEEKINSIEVFNTMGAIVFSTNNIHKLSNEINISSCDKGIYFIKIKSSSNKVHFQKIIKN